jgi:uncharacterized membrane protein
MKLRLATLSLGLAAVSAGPAIAQDKEQAIAKPEAQDGFRVCNLSSQALEVAKATYSAKRAADETFVAEGWYQFEPGQCRTLWPGKLQYR